MRRGHPRLRGHHISHISRIGAVEGVVLYHIVQQGFVHLIFLYLQFHFFAEGGRAFSYFFSSKRIFSSLSVYFFSFSSCSFFSFSWSI
mmetsp:Transcript_10404/g.1640  ORF Transcript_10404/g.1640 Transcript_10404/m.1640 type:complete len:88 (-) Transcript_10404:39-302(-)